MRQFFKAGILTGLLISITSCALLTMLPGAHLILPSHHYYAYDIQAENPQPTFTKVHSTQQDNEKHRWLQLENNDINFRLNVRNMRITMQLSNKTDKPIKIHWPESSIKINKQDQEPLVASSSTLSNLQNPGFPQTASILPAKKTTLVHIYPHSLSEWQTFTNSSTGYWKSTHYLWSKGPQEGQSTQDMQADADLAIGKMLEITLPLFIGGRKETFVFNLQVKATAIHKATW